MNLEELEITLRGLLNGEHSSLHLTFNDGNGPNYMSVRDWLVSGGPGSTTDWISEEEREKGIATNSMWEVQWYPNNPTSFECIAAASLPAIFAYLAQEKSA